MAQLSHNEFCLQHETNELQCFVSISELGLSQRGRALRGLAGGVGGGRGASAGLAMQMSVAPPSAGPVRAQSSPNPLAPNTKIVLNATGASQAKLGARDGLFALVLFIYESRQLRGPLSGFKILRDSGWRAERERKREREREREEVA